MSNGVTPDDLPINVAIRQFKATKNPVADAQEFADLVANSLTQLEVKVVTIWKVLGLT